VIDALDDIPDLVEGSIDRELEHQRDITVVLTKNVFAQTKGKSQSISLPVSQLEDEVMPQSSHAFCDELLRQPQRVITAAPAPPPGAVSASVKASGPKDERNALIAETERLKVEILAGLQNFPQDVKIVEMIGERDIDLSGLKARL
jgi:hypothetical protein